jgi:hypothetical protein
MARNTARGIIPNMNASPNVNPIVVSSNVNPAVMQKYEKTKVPILIEAYFHQLALGTVLRNILVIFIFLFLTAVGGCG